MNVYFNEYNIRMGPLCYLPLVSGLLRARAETSAVVRANYTFMPFIYAIDAPAAILARYAAPPDVATFSNTMWNERLNLTVAKEVKTRWPECLVVFGGPQTPHHPEPYMRDHPFIDVCVRAEGEDPFAEVLERLVETRDFSGIPDVTWRGGENPEKRPFSRDLDDYPSPYIEGLFDELAAGGEFQAIIETNRGCPFQCTFCYWGRGGLSRKYKYHAIERVRRELEWCAAHKIRYVFNADSNFGMHRRDEEIAAILVEIKSRTGYPEKFRTCFGKNTNDRIFEIGALFHKHDIEKGITLARQSNDATVLKNIKRANISMGTYRALQKRFNAAGVPIYTEFILGLPGETRETWAAGIDEILRAELKNQLFIYFAQVFPNTDLAEPEYRRRFGIETRLIELTEIHGSVRAEGWVKEHEEIVVATDSMPLADWRDMAVLSWMTMLMHSLKLGYFVLDWLHRERGEPHIEVLKALVAAPGPGPVRSLVERFYAKADDMLGGNGRGCIGPGEVYWDVEEAAFIDIMADSPAFYADMRKILGVPQSVIEYQRSRIPTPDMFGGDIERWARETIIWGRKSGTMLMPEKEAA